MRIVAALLAAFESFLLARLFAYSRAPVTVENVLPPFFQTVAFRRFSSVHPRPNEFKSLSGDNGEEGERERDLDLGRLGVTGILLTSYVKKKIRLSA